MEPATRDRLRESAVIASQYDHLGRRFTFAIESGNIALGYRPADVRSRLGSTFFFIDCRHGIAGAAVLEVLAESGSSETFDALRIKPPLLQGATGCRCEATFGIAGNGTDVTHLALAVDAEIESHLGVTIRTARGAGLPSFLT